MAKYSINAQFVLVLLAASLLAAAAVHVEDVEAGGASGGVVAEESSATSTGTVSASALEAAGSDEEWEAGESQVGEGGSGSRWRRVMQEFAGFVRTSGRKGYCGKNPYLCNQKKPTCCNKFCTNLKTDKYNCGKCGRLCSKGRACCSGVPVNLNNDPSHCGRCGFKCQKNEKCSYGLCNYAGAGTA